MYVARVRIQNYRCFKDTVVEFRPGINVLIGENNAGKTSLLNALALVFDRRPRRRPGLYDFYHSGEPPHDPPSITVTVTLRGSDQDTTADKSVVATWLTKLDHPWEATLTYRFFLAEKEAEQFRAELPADLTVHRHRRTLERYLPKYVSRVYGGNPDDHVQAEPEHLDLFGYDFVTALRDVESEMFSGRSPLMRRMLGKVLDADEPDSAERHVRRELFADSSVALREMLISRLDTDALFQLVMETGAGDGGTLGLHGIVDEDAFMGALKLFVSTGECDLPILSNGLGYNNLVYISLLLSHMDFRCKYEIEGPNALVFPMLVVEEPEAHLHPALQYKLLRFLRRRVNQAGTNRQVFVTTHSTHVTAACSLDDLICLAVDEPGAPPRVAYPGRVFADDAAGTASKNYVERFLDATKSSMLFAKSVVLVEGMAELLVVPVLAEYLGLPLDFHRVALVAVEGSTFKHFLPLFGACATEELRSYAIPRPVACLVDADPARRTKEQSSRYKSCWPYQIGKDEESHEYRPLSGVVWNLQAASVLAPNVKVLHGQKTFEYDLAECNTRSTVLVTDACHDGECLRVFCESGELLHPDLEQPLLQDPSQPLGDLGAIANSEEQLRARFATYYALSTRDAKGEHAFSLSVQLRRNLDAAPDERLPVTVPPHIVQAVHWCCGVEMAEEAE
jgi:putative ATP-dependent endonuclease of the OLD family